MSVRSAIRTALKEYSPLIKQLLEAVIAAGGARPDAQTPAAVMNLIIQHEANLQQLVKQLEEKQAFHQKLQSMQAEIAQKEQIIMDLALQLRQVEKMLEQSISDAKARLQLMEQSLQHQIDVEELVKYAHRISLTTSAPPRWRPGMPLNMYKPPAPQEDQMRSGVLYAQIAKAPVPPPLVDELPPPSAPELPPQVAQWKKEMAKPAAADVMPAPVNPLGTSGGLDIDLDLNPELTAAEDEEDVQWES